MQTACITTGVTDLADCRNKWNIISTTRVESFVVISNIRSTSCMDVCQELLSSGLSTAVRHAQTFLEGGPYFYMVNHSLAWLWRRRRRPVLPEQRLHMLGVENTLINIGQASVHLQLNVHTVKLILLKLLWFQQSLMELFPGTVTLLFKLLRTWGINVYLCCN